MRRVSILIPTYKEQRIAESLAELAAHVGRLDGTSFEILVVDDSPDEDRARIQAWVDENGARFPNVVFRVVAGEHRGKGHAVKVGALASTGDVVFTIDADLPVPLEHIEEFLRILDAGGADIVIGERPMMRNVWNPLRFVLSRGLLLFQRALVFQSAEYPDTQCGFKAFRGDVLRAMASRQIVDGGMYDIELLYIAMRNETAVAHRRVAPKPETRPSKINIWKCIYTDPRDLARVKLRGLSGAYDAPRGGRRA